MANPPVTHAAAWVGVYPGNNESGGKRKGQQRRCGNVHLSGGLMLAAFAALRTKDSHSKARFWKVAARADKKRAAIAIAHSIFKAIHQMFSANVDFKDLGDDYFDRFVSRRAELRFGASTRIHELRGHTN